MGGSWVVGTFTLLLIHRLFSIESFYSQPKVPLTLLRLNLLTGHKHQLRIHLAECLEGKASVVHSLLRHSTSE
jgi:hypothetical protein